MNSSSQMVPVLANQFQPSTMGACDSIDVELHNGNPPYNTQFSTRAVLNQNGTSTCVFPSLTGSKYIVVKHRNAIETWSSQAIPMDTMVTYNFSDAISRAYSSNQVLVSTSPVRYAFYSGDILQDENIDLLDIGDSD